jgi:hypothetical protein
MVNDPTAKVIINKMNIPIKELKEIGKSFVSIKVEGKKTK